MAYEMNDTDEIKKEPKKEGTIQNQLAHLPSEDEEPGVDYTEKKSESQQKVMLFDVSQFYNLNVDNDCKELLQFMNNFNPTVLSLDTKLKPFIPAYIPSIGEVDAFIKIPRPDNIQEDLGLSVLDEPVLNGTDPYIFSLELTQTLKTKLNPNINVRSIENAEKQPKQIQNWIEKIGELHKTKMAPNVSYSKQMPDIESLMQVWPEKLEKIMKVVQFPDEKLNISIENYSKIICNILDIPIHKLNNDKSTIEALHVFFTLYDEFIKSQHFQQYNNDIHENN